jgi:hypothetical protein
MHYWNRANFEGLDVVAAEATASFIPNGFALYCTLRSSGQRSKALDALRVFLADTQSLPLEERKRITCWLLEAQVRAPQIHQLLPHPVMKGLVESTLEAWVVSSPNDAVVHRWRGYVFHDNDSLRLALRIDPEDSLARSQLIAELLAAVEFSTHHLGEGQFLGEEEQAALQLQEVAGLTAELPDSAHRNQLQARFEDQHRLLTDWTEYKANPCGTFSHWCAERHKAHDWPSIVYYGKHSDA